MGEALKVEEQLFTVDEVAERLKVSRWMVYQLMKSEDPSKKLFYVTVGKRRRIKESQLNDYIKRNTL